MNRLYIEVKYIILYGEVKCYKWIYYIIYRSKML